MKSLYKKIQYFTIGVIAAIILGFGIFIMISTSSESVRLMGEVNEEQSVKSTEDILISYDEALKILGKHVVAKVKDIETGMVYSVKRIGGKNHADVETLTSEDTKMMKKTYGGRYSWDRRAVLVKVGDTIIAASVAGMPHAGRDDAPFGIVVDNRSGGAGRGINLNSIRDNNLNGVIDIYFYNSRVPGINRIDPRHQYMVESAAEYFKKLDNLKFH